MLRPPTAPDATFAPLVLDDEGAEVRRFCSTELALQGDIDTRGLCALRCSSSAQFSSAGFRDLIERLGRPGPDELYVVDLRQESHGFLGDAAVSWYAKRNWGCVGLSPEEASTLEMLRLKMLADGDVAWVRRADLVKAELPHAPEPRPCRDVRSERELVALPPGHYVRLPVADHTRPSDEIVEAFRSFVDGLRGRPWVHFHCRGGKGRSATFLALYDILRNGATVDLEAILTRNRLLTGYDLEASPKPGSDKAPYLAERLSLLRAVHASRWRAH